MANYQKLSINDIKLGQPLPYSVYDKAGILLLKTGCSINVERHLAILIANGLYFMPDASIARPSSPEPDAQKEEVNTFLLLDSAKVKLQRLFEQFREGRLRDDFISRIDALAITVQEACSLDTDAALANLHLDYETSYTVVHHMQAAILCEILGNKLKIKGEARLSLIKAALTHDMALLDIQDSLDQQTTPLDSHQKERIRAHPQSSARILRELGVTDATWLNAVEYHHERLDGSGYAEALSGDSIKIPTRILAVADIYSAMIRDRPYRRAMVSSEAMRRLLLEQGQKADLRFIQLLIKEIGVFPPGALVQLANKEISVVKQRHQNSVCPTVYSFIRSTGMPMISPLKRETENPEHKVENIVPFSSYRRSISVIRGLWIKSAA